MILFAFLFKTIGLLSYWSLPKNQNQYKPMIARPIHWCDISPNNINIIISKCNGATTVIIFVKNLFFRSRTDPVIVSLLINGKGSLPNSLDWALSSLHPLLASIMPFRFLVHHLFHIIGDHQHQLSNKPQRFCSELWVSMLSSSQKKGASKKGGQWRKEGSCAELNSLDCPKCKYIHSLYLLR